MQKIYAQIKNGIVVNKIVLEDDNLVPVFAQGYDYFKRVDDIVPEPDMLWNYDSVTDTFSPNT